jgi:hypothetical protein
LIAWTKEFSSSLENFVIVAPSDFYFLTKVLKAPPSL